MSRESCISHRASSIFVMVRQDYYEITDRDTTAAALLSLFEYWASYEIGKEPANRSPIIGNKPISTFEEHLLGIATDKQIRIRLKNLEQLGFIAIFADRFSGKSSSYQFFADVVQSAIDDLGKPKNPPSVKEPTPKTDLGQRTDPPWSNDQPTSVKEPTPLGQRTDLPRSNDRSSIYKKYIEIEDQERIEIEARASAESHPIEVVECELISEEDLEVSRSPATPQEPCQEAPAIATTKKRRAKSSAAADFSAFVELYNEKKPRIWPRVIAVDKIRQRIFSNLIKESGGTDQALAVLEGALAWARSSDWYATHNLTLEEFASKNKIRQSYEKQVNRQEIGDRAYQAVTAPNAAKNFHRDQALSQIMERYKR